jgi:hypothetical protein
MRTFNAPGGEFQISFAEVVKVEYEDNNPLVFQGIQCKGLNASVGSADGDPTTFLAKPLSPYLRRVPLQGEIVMLIAGPSPAISAINPAAHVYYIDIVNVQGLVNHNSVPTAGKVTKGGGLNSAAAAGAIGGSPPPSPDKNFFEDDNASYIQHYVGDVIVEGRYGQSLRFSSTQKNKGIFSKSTIWEQGAAGDPITILRNSKFKGPGNKLYAEDLEKDDSMIILTSTQKLPLKPASDAKKAANEVSIQDKYEKNQILLNSGRLILNARQEDILAYAKKGVHISADKIAIDAKSKFTVDSPAIHLGAQATEPIIFGQKWATWMNNLITALGSCFVATGVGPSGPLMGNPNWSQVVQLQGQINTLLSQISKTK